MKPAIFVCFACVNLALFLTMAADKRAARKKRRRVRETTLLALAVLGGAPGGILAMLLLRHKTRKKAFSIGFPVILLFHLSLGYVLFFP